MMEAQTQILATVKQKVTLEKVSYNIRRILEEVCKKDIFEMGLGWYGFTMKVFKEFWMELLEALVIVANQSFLKGEMEGSMLTRLIKPVLKQVSYSFC